MGSSKNYNKDGGFDKRTYKEIGITSNGIKVLGKLDGGSSNTPLYSNTPYTMYASMDSNTGVLKQITAYGGKEGRQKIKEMDWSHGHDSFKPGDIHVHLYDDGKKTKKYRKPSKKEYRIVKMAIYGR